MDDRHSEREARTPAASGKDPAWRSRSVCSRRPEVVLMSPQTPDEVVELVSSAIKDGTPLTLGDDKGRTVVVPGDKIA